MLGQIRPSLEAVKTERRGGRSGGSRECANAGDEWGEGRLGMNERGSGRGF